MAKKRTTKKPKAEAPLAVKGSVELPEHDHPLPEHGHPLFEHNHRLPEHDHPVPEHDHAAVPEHIHEHEHPTVPKHGHDDLLGHVRGSVRALLTAIEAGGVNTEQRKAIHAVRVVIGDAYGPGCAHENTAYEVGDKLICQDCRSEV